MFNLSLCYRTFVWMCSEAFSEGFSDLLSLLTERVVCFQVQEERIFHQQVKCVITEEKTCRVCKKKIGNR